MLSRSIAPTDKRLAHDAHSSQMRAQHDRSRLGHRGLVARWRRAVRAPRLLDFRRKFEPFSSLSLVVRPPESVTDPAAHERRWARAVASVLFMALAALASDRADAQIIGAHLVHVPASDGRRASLGLQGELGIITSTRYLDLWPSLAIEYERQSDLGPGRGRVAAELRLLPGRTESRFHPYLGVGISANQSGGNQSEWSGTLAGLQGMAGVMMVPSDHVPLALLLEEWYGYVRGHEHATATHLGLMFSFR